MGLFDGIVDTLKNEKEFFSEASKGDRYYKNHEYGSAKKHYDRALQFKDDDLSVLEKKLICEYYLKNYEEVVKYNLANNTDFKLIKAKSYFYLKNYEKALDYANQILKSDEYNNDALLLKGSLLFNQHDSYAINFFKRCRNEFGDDFNFNLKCFIDYMYCLISNDNYIDAITISNLILKKSKDNIDALIVKGLSFYENKSYSKALEIFDKVYSLYNNKMLDKYLDKYIECIVKDKSLSHDEIYEKISHLSDDNKYVFKYKALTSSFFKTSQEHLDYINSILDDYKDDEEILLKKANLCYELGLMDDSLNSLSNLNTNNSILFKIKLLNELKKYDDIINIYESSKNIIKDSPSLLMIADSFFYIKKYGEAKNIYDNLIENNFSFDLKNYIDCVLIIARECEDSNDSINYYNEILKIDDKNILVLTQLYKTHLEQKDYEKSLEIINKILTIKENDDVIADKILVLNSLERYDEASDLLNKVSGVDINIKFNLLTRLKEYGEAFKYIDEVDETVENVSISKIDVNYHLGNYSEVLNNVDNALKNNKENINLLLFKAHSLCKLGKYNESIFVYNSILRINDENIDALTGKSYCLFKLKKFYDALDIYDELIDVTEDINILEKKALSLYNIDEKLEALDDFEQILNSDKSKINNFKKEYIDSLNFKGNSENKNNSLNEAITYFDKVLAINSQNIDALYGKLYSYSKLNDDNQVINISNEILKLKMDEDVLSKKAVSLFNIEDYINSINCFEELFAMNNNLNDYFDEYNSALRSFALNEYDNKNYDTALKYFDKYLNNIPDEEIAYYKADCYYKLGDLDNSIKCFETLDINKYKSQYIEVLYEKSLNVDNSEKINLLNLILKLDKDNHDALILKSKTLFELEDYYGSVDCCKTILNKDSNNLEILKIYAKSLFNLHNYENAYEIFSDFNDEESKGYLEKSKENIIESLLEKSENYYSLKEWNELINTSDEILIYDSINYDALLYKSKALFNLNQFNQAYGIFKSFNLENISDYKNEYLETLKELGFENNDLIYLNEYLSIEFNWDVLFKKSEILYQSNCHDEAIECYETLLLKDNSKLDLFKDNYIELLLNKAKNYCNLSKYNQSLDYLDNILKLDTQNEKALIYKANCLFKLKNYENTLELSNNILEINQDNKNIILLKAESLYQLNDYLESIKCFNQLDDSKFNNKREIVIKTFVNEYKNKIKDCDEHQILDSLDNILSHIPNNYELLKIKSDALYKLNRYEECIEASNECLNIKKTADMVENILNSLSSLENYDNFIELYESLIYKALKNKFKKDYLKALTNIGLKLFNYNDFEKATDYFNKIINIEYDENILNSLAVSYYKLDEYDDAVKTWDILLANNSSIESYKKDYITSIYQIMDENSKDYLINLNKILNVDENNVDALIKKADLLVSNSNFKEAHEIYGKLKSIDNDISYHFEENYLLVLKELGLQEYNMDSHENALNYFNEFLEINEDQNIRYLKADCHYKLNQLDESISNYQLISIIDEYKDDYINVLYAKAIESDNQESIRYCDLILDLENDNLNALILKSKTLFELKKYDESKNICLDILNIDENNFEIIVIYAKSLYKLKDYENAFIQFKKAISIKQQSKLIECMEKTRELLVEDLLDQSKHCIDDYEKLLKLSDKVLKYDANNYNGLLNKANALFNLNKYFDALSIFRNLDSEKINDYKDEYLESLRKIMVKTHEYAKILDYCNEYLNIEHDLDILIKKAESLYYLHKTSDAIDLYQEILNEDASKINDFKNHYIDLLIEMGNYYSSEIFNFRKAIDYWDEILKHDKDNIEVLIYKTKDLFKLDEYDDVLNCCDEILNIDENNVEILLIKSDLLFKLGKYDDVIDTCNQIIEKDENCFKAFELKSKSLYEINNYSDTIDIINQALKIKFDLQLYNLKEITIDKYLEDYLNEINDLDNWELVLKSLESKLEFVPYCMDLLELKADALFNLQKYELALDCYDTLLLFNFNVNAMLNKLYCLFNLDKKEDFIKLFAELKQYYDEIEKKLIDYYYNSMSDIVFSLFDNGQYDDVLVYVNDLLKQNEDIDLMILKADTLFMLNDYSSALEEYELILSSDVSKLSQIKDKYTECLFIEIASLINENKFSDSLVLINKILDINPRNEHAKYLKYSCLRNLIDETYQNNDFEGSLTLINDYLKFKHDDEVLILKGKILNNLERFKDAIETFESIKSNFDKYKSDYYLALESYVMTYDLDDDELLRCYDKMLNIYKDDEILIKKAKILLNKDLLIESKHCLDNITSIFDDYLNFMVSLAIKFKEGDDYENSLDLFNKVLSFDKDNIDALSNCIEIYFDQKEHDSIIKLGYHLLKLNKTTLKDLYYFAISCYMQEEYTSAYDICQLILDNEYFEDIDNIQNESKQEIIKNLNEEARELIKKEFYVSALINYDKILTYDNLNQSVLLDKASLLVMDKRYGEAIECYKVILDINPNKFLVLSILRLLNLENKPFLVFEEYLNWLNKSTLNKKDCKSELDNALNKLNNDERQACEKILDYAEKFNITSFSVSFKDLIHKYLILFNHKNNDENDFENLILEYAIKGD